MTPTNDKTRQIELLISNLLRIGVVTSLCVIVFGSALIFVHHPEYASSRESMAPLTEPGAARFPHTMHDVISGLKSLRGQAVIVLGLLLLIATPVMRVAVSIFAFVYEKDPAFVVITTIVLLLLLLSFVLGATG